MKVTEPSSVYEAVCDEMNVLAWRQRYCFDMSVRSGVDEVCCEIIAGFRKPVLVVKNKSRPLCCQLLSHSYEYLVPPYTSGRTSV